ncbi:hypothetical protein CVV65_04615 [Kyrpidia spormannii]|uniref:Uncharacterized protein n=1 Tax=Kyrpidia spormannii TaxID=2055160 RepID=A0A2K8N6U7_9BACL|nr:DUF190 domain-containing protein [Kyrpidia spormannii]ATY84320.1 hypothetical protein CVV65_04615 [Kyrpidia spormannii]CAB3391837.1 conserved protein of unknown function [Kyrpidia spormannii]
MWDAESRLRLRIYCTERDRIHGRPTARVLMELARSTGLAGATLYRALEGFGRSGVQRSWRYFETESALPLIVEFVDEESVIRRYLNTLDHLSFQGFLTIERVEQITWSGPR